MTYWKVIYTLTLRKRRKMKNLKILKNESIQKAQQYYSNIASIFELDSDSKDLVLHLLLLRKVSYTVRRIFNFWCRNHPCWIFYIRNRIINGFFWSWLQFFFEYFRIKNQCARFCVSTIKKLKCYIKCLKFFILTCISFGFS